MRVKNAFKILISDSGVIYKAIFFRLITTSIIALVAYFAVFPLIKPILQSTELTAFWHAIVDMFKDFIYGDGIGKAKEAVLTSFNAFVAEIQSNKNALITAVLGVGLFLFLANLIERMGNFVLAFLYDGYMSALTKFSLIPTLLANIGKAFLYSLITVPIVLLFDCIVFGLAVLIVVYGIQVISIFAIIVAVIFVIVALSFKFTLLSRFLPNIIVGKQSIGSAFANTFKQRKNLHKVLGSYVFMLMISFYLNVSVATFTLGVGLFVSIPLTGNMNILIALVDYYNEYGKKYYTSSEHVALPKQLQENADLLKHM